MSNLNQPVCCVGCKAVAEFIAKDIRPVAIVEGSGFIRLLEVLEPKYKVPSRKHINKVLRDLYDEVRSRVNQELQLTVAEKDNVSGAS